MVSLEEAEEALGSLKKGSAPGVDGLPFEFYKAFWPLVGPDLVAVFRECREKGTLPWSMWAGVVSLLFKKGDMTDLGNWRPITLLTADYKILAKVLVRRLSRVMPVLVRPDQAGAVKGRSTTLHLALVRDILEWAEQCQLPLALLSLDQEKAFDRVSHTFLWAVLARLGLGQDFIGWVRLLYRGAFSRVRVNGHLSGPVWQKGGVRQGCPLSPLLYVLYLEPLMARLQGAAGWRGLHLVGGGGVPAKAIAFADDMTLFLTEDRF